MLNIQGICLDVVLSKYKKLDLLMYNYSDSTRNWVLKVSNDGNILDGIITHSVVKFLQQPHIPAVSDSQLLKATWIRVVINRERRRT